MNVCISTRRNEIEARLSSISPLDYPRTDYFDRNCHRSNCQGPPCCRWAARRHWRRGRGWEPREHRLELAVLADEGSAVLGPALNGFSTLVVCLLGRRVEGARWGRTTPRALGIDAGVSKSQVSRICADLDGAVEEFRQRRLDHVESPTSSSMPPTSRPTRVPGWSKAIVVATGVAADGTREVLGLAVGDSEDKAFWTAFLRSLRARGLAGVRLVISDAHEGSGPPSRR